MSEANDPLETHFRTFLRFFAAGKNRVDNWFWQLKDNIFISENDVFDFSNTEFDKSLDAFLNDLFRRRSSGSQPDGFLPLPSIPT